MSTLSNVGYHYLSRTDNFKRIWGHDFELFKKHVDYFREKYQITSLEEIERYNYQPESNNLLISFDDGLKEHMFLGEYLAKLKINGLFNIPACILRQEPANPQVWHFGMAHYGVRKFYSFTKKAVSKICPEKQSLLPLAPGKMETMELHKFIRNFFKRALNYFEARQILMAIYQKHLLKDFPDFMNRVHLNAGDIINLSKQGHSIGSHTDTHCVARDIINNPELIKKELIEPRITLSKLINQEIKVLTYPFGAVDDIIDDNEILKQAGYKIGLTTFKGSKEFNQFQIGRYCPSSLETIDEIRVKIWSYPIKKD